MDALKSVSTRYPRWWAVAPGLLLVVAAAWGFGILYDDLVDNDDLWEADGPLLDALSENRVDWLTAVLTVVTTIFGPAILPVLVGIGALLWWRLSGSWRDPLLMAGALVFAAALSTILKIIVGRPRPEPEAMVVPGLETSMSFPSGHTAGATTLVLVTGYLLWRRHAKTFKWWMWCALSTLVIVVVGGSRLYLGYHFLTDVLSGFCLGMLVLGVVVSVARLHDASRRSESAHEASAATAHTSDSFSI